MKKAFSETKFGQFINGAKDILPELGTVAVQIATGNVGGVIASVGDIIKGNKERSAQTRELAVRWEILKMEFQKEMFELEIADRDSARTRETEMAKTGKTDWLMYATGITGLLSFVLIVYAVIFMDVPESAILHQMVGMIEGVALAIFGYYFGSSKSSSDKTELLNKK